MTLVLAAEVDTRYHTPMRRLLSLSLLLLACGNPFVARPTRVVIEPGVNDFWAVPLPSELRRQDDGTYNLDRWPGGRPSIVVNWLTSLDKRVTDGWGVSSGAFFMLSDAIDAKTLPQNATDSMADSSTVSFIDIDPASPEYGRHFPLEVTVSTEDLPFAPKNLMSVVPLFGFTRRPLTTYAVLVNEGLKDANGVLLGRTEGFHKAMEGDKDADAKLSTALKPLLDYLKAKKLSGTRIIGATVFKTFDPSWPLVNLAKWVETQPLPTSETWVKGDTYNSFTLYTSGYTGPHIQSGPKPGRGAIVWNAEKTAPILQGSQRIRLALSVPKTPMPANGYPLMLYLHGSGGEYREAIDRGPLPPTRSRPDQGEPPLGSGPAEWLGKRGIATLGFDFPLHGDREMPPDTTGRQLYDVFGDVDSSVDNMQVAAMEVVNLTRMLPTLQVNLDGGGSAKFDMSKLTAMGHSMGSTIGIPTAGVEPRIKAWVFSGAGGMLIDVATETIYPVDLKTTVGLLIGFTGTQELKRSHPLLHAFQTLWDYTDPSAKARYVAQEPRSGRAPLPAFEPQGFIDGYFAPRAQQAVGIALGGNIVGAETEPTMTDAMHLAGRMAQPYPLSKNLNGVTVGVAQLGVPFNLGHYIVFDNAGVQYQVACFFSGLGTADGPKIYAPAGGDDACPQ